MLRGCGISVVSAGKYCGGTIPMAPFDKKVYGTVLAIPPDANSNVVNQTRDHKVKNPLTVVLSNVLLYQALLLSFDRASFK
jgi:hypothetical protein